MSAGTITLSNKSKSISGINTNFMADVKHGDFIVVTVGGIPYTLPIQTVGSNTSMTLVSEYTGPTQSGAAWYAIPQVALNMVTAALVAQSTEALRGLNYDKANWQQVFSGNGDITVTLPDQSQYKGPSWKSISDSLEKKANALQVSKELGEKANKSDLGNSAELNLGTTNGTVAAGDDERLNTVNGKKGGRIDGEIEADGFEVWGETPFVDFHYNNSDVDFTTRIISEGPHQLAIRSSNTKTKLYVDGGYSCKQGVNGTIGANIFNLNWTSSRVLQAWIDTSMVGTISFNSSDLELKIKGGYQTNSTDALSQVLKWQPSLYKFRERGVIAESDERLGFIANDLVKVSPYCVSGEGLPQGAHSNLESADISKAYNLEPLAMIATLSLAVQELSKKIDELNSNKSMIIPH